MNQLFCKVGDLAVTVEAELPINIGNVVKIIGGIGYRQWSTFTAETFLWKVEVASSERPLIYENADGSIEEAFSGRVPDCYLRPIRPDELEWDQSASHDEPLPTDEAKEQEVEYV
ncbi:hypothetical protein [Polynucleobacter antarcticus]|uniref:Uncharacterized protein n=1 Tax=Polynucleobacter antarcticus TaxID=1743162 RepID=A0A6M9PQ37_9BURK|nr:hypothetical protein [Polynucleobacter antarcticus]QKM62699.1 hypothetical protein DCO16_06295 [Polynucleobacter antarcticus]